MPLPLQVEYAREPRYGSIQTCIKEVLVSKLSLWDSEPRCNGKLSMEGHRLRICDKSYLQGNPVHGQQFLL